MPYSSVFKPIFFVAETTNLTGGLLMSRELVTQCLQKTGDSIAIPACE